MSQRLSTLLLLGVAAFVCCVGPGCVSEPFALENRSRQSWSMPEASPTQPAPSPITADNARARCDALWNDVDQEWRQLAQESR